MWRCGCAHGCPSSWSGRWDVFTHWWTSKAWPFIKRWYWILIVVALIGVGFWLPTTNKFRSILAWIRNLNVIYSIIAFISIQALLTVLFLPGALFVLMAGFVLGLWLGTLVAWSGSVLGAVGAFLLGRQCAFQRPWIPRSVSSLSPNLSSLSLLSKTHASYTSPSLPSLTPPISIFCSYFDALLCFLPLYWSVIAEKVRRWVAESPFFMSVMRAIDSVDEGWKITFLLRLSPLMPYALINYLLSSTQLTLWTYFWTSALGVLPPTALYVYLGTSAASLSDILGDAFETPEEEASEAPSPPAPTSPVAAPSAMDTTQLWVMGIGVVVTIAVAVLVTIFTSRAIKRASRLASLGGAESVVGEVVAASLNDAILEGSSSEDEGGDLTSIDRLEEDSEHSVQMKEMGSSVKRNNSPGGGGGGGGVAVGGGGGGTVNATSSSAINNGAGGGGGGSSSPASLSNSATSDTELLDGHKGSVMSEEEDEEDGGVSAADSNSNNKTKMMTMILSPPLPSSSSSSASSTPSATLSDSFLQLDSTPFSFSHSPTNSRISLAESHSSV